MVIRVEDSFEGRCGRETVYPTSAGSGLTGLKGPYAELTIGSGVNRALWVPGDPDSPYLWRNGEWRSHKTEKAQDDNKT